MCSENEAVLLSQGLVHGAGVGLQIALQHYGLSVEISIRSRRRRESCHRQKASPSSMHRTRHWCGKVNYSLLWRPMADKTPLGLHIPQMQAQVRRS